MFGEGNMFIQFGWWKTTQSIKMRLNQITQMYGWWINNNDNSPHHHYHNHQRQHHHVWRRKHVHPVKWKKHYIIVLSWELYNISYLWVLSSSCEPSYLLKGGFLSSIRWEGYIYPTLEGTPLKFNIDTKNGHMFFKRIHFPRPIILGPSSPSFLGV